jgi:aldose 1-epimerase
MAEIDPSGDRRVDVEPWGTTGNGRPVHRYRLTNGAGASVEAVTYGASITSVLVPDRQGTLGPVVLGCSSIEALEANTAYLGATIGRYGNRIGGARFELDGACFELEANNGPSNLHGGPDGFDRQVWTAQSAVTPQGPEVRFHLVSPDGQSGFPGRLDVDVAMRWSDACTLTIDYSATTDRPTVCNLTNHTYFDLSAGSAPDVTDHVVWIDAGAITEVDADLVPTGRTKPVADTPFDFRRPYAIGSRIDAADRLLDWGSGYDHNFVLDRPEQGVAARVVEPVSGRTLELSTSEPGLQFYTGNHLDGSSGRPGRRYGPRSGFCLETQHPPDSPNQPGFPSTVLRPGQTYRSTTSYRFGIDQVSDVTA